MSCGISSKSDLNSVKNSDDRKFLEIFNNYKRERTTNNYSSSDKDKDKVSEIQSPRKDLLFKIEKVPNLTNNDNVQDFGRQLISMIGYNFLFCQNLKDNKDVEDMQKLILLWGNNLTDPYKKLLCNDPINNIINNNYLAKLDYNSK
jgi:hypothetical protein